MRNLIELNEVRDVRPTSTSTVPRVSYLSHLLSLSASLSLIQVDAAASGFAVFDAADAYLLNGYYAHNPHRATRPSTSLTYL